MFACCFPSAKSILTAVPPSHLPSSNVSVSSEATALTASTAKDALAKDGLRAAEAVSTSEITACAAAAMTFSSTEVSNKIDEAKSVAAKLNEAISSATNVTDSLNAKVAAAVASVPEEDEEAVLTEFSDTDEDAVVPELTTTAEKL